MTLIRAAVAYAFWQTIWRRWFLQARFDSPTRRRVLTNWLRASTRLKKAMGAPP